MIYNDVCNVCFLHVPLTCFTTVSRKGTNATRLQLLAKWLFSIPLLSPNLEDNSHLAGWSSQSKYVSCFPNMEVSKISMISPKLCPRKIMSWFEMMSVIYLKEILQNRPVLLLAARLLFGGNSHVARTPGASRPAVPSHLGMLERLAMTMTYQNILFLASALPVYLTQTTSQGPHTSTASPTKNSGLGPRISGNVDTNYQAHTSSSSTWWNCCFKI